MNDLLMCIKNQIETSKPGKRITEKLGSLGQHKKDEIQTEELHGVLLKRTEVDIL